MANKKRYGKVFVAFGVIALFVIMLTVGVFAEESNVPGDANGDGCFNGKDITRMLKYISQYDEATQTSAVEINSAADVNEDGIINLLDVQLLTDHLAFNKPSIQQFVLKQNQYQVINKSMYYFNHLGLIVRNEENNGYQFSFNGKLYGSNIFVTVDGDTYYLTNNTIAYNYQVINGSIYYFDNNGIMVKDCELDGHTFGVDGKLCATNTFVTIEGNTYYLVNNVVSYNYQVIDGNIYYFGTNGVLEKDVDLEGYHFDADGKLCATNVFVTLGGNTYYVVNNTVSFNYQVIDGNVYYFGTNGVMIKDAEVEGYVFDADGKLVANNIFINIEGNTYYIVNNVTAYNYQVIDGNVYYFGANGIMIKDAEVEDYVFDADGKLVANNIFINIEGNTYYIVNNVTAYNYQVIDGNIYYFGANGIMIKDCDFDGYVFGVDGKLCANNLFVNIEGDTYYVVNNVISYNYQVIDGNIYYFGTNGIMIKDCDFDGYVYGADGKLCATNIFVTIEGNTYYVVNNVVSYNYQVIDGNIYYFGANGIMIKDCEFDGYVFGADGKIYGTNLFINIEGDTYYIVNNAIVYNYQIIDGSVYYFGANGIMIKDCEFDGYVFGADGKICGTNIFINIEGDTYCIINNVIAYNYQIVNGNIYYFGSNGIMIKDCDFDGYYFDIDGKIVATNIFINIEGNTYYLINNTIVYNYQLIGENVYYFGTNGIMIKDCEFDGYLFGIDGKLCGTNIFVNIEGNTYYIINNVIAYNYQIIDGNIYYFGTNGIMIKDCHFGGYYFGTDGKIVATNIFINIEGNVYYIVNNAIVYNYQVINGNVYYFGTNGIMIKDCHFDGYYFDADGKIVATNIFINIEGDVYYIVNNVIVYNYQVINGNVYYFGTNGIMVKDCEFDGYYFDADGKIIATNIFINIEGDVYYVVNNVIMYNYQIINGNVYYFDANGIMIKDCHFDGYYFGVNGMLIGHNIVIEIDGVLYYVLNNIAYEAVTINGVVTESDNDEDEQNNEVLEGVECKAEFAGFTFETTTDENGKFCFENIPCKDIELTFSAEGYIDATLYLYEIPEEIVNETFVIVMDKAVSNTLKGKVTVADADMNFSNNQALSGATVTLTRNTSTNSFEKSTETDAFGGYVFEDLTAGVYSLTVTCEGYITVNQTVYVRYNETTVNNIIIEAIDNSDDTEGYAAGRVTDARTAFALAGMTVNIRNGLNNRVGEIIATTQTDINGYYTTEALKPGNYTAEFVDQREIDNEEERYQNVVIAIKILPNMTIENQNAVMSNGIGLTADGMRIVLNWGATPRDLDSHLYMYYDNGNTDHIYYGDKIAYDSSANLDVDDTSSYGPETVTIVSFEEGVYSYYVHDYSNGGYSASMAMAGSGATISVYLDGGTSPVYTFGVPTDEAGYWWHVFDYDFTTGEFTVINRISCSIDERPFALAGADFGAMSQELPPKEAEEWEENEPETEIEQAQEIEVESEAEIEAEEEAEAEESEAEAEAEEEAEAEVEAEAEAETEETEETEAETEEQTETEQQTEIQTQEPAEEEAEQTDQTEETQETSKEQSSDVETQNQVIEE